MMYSSNDLLIKEMFKNLENILGKKILSEKDVLNANNYSKKLWHIYKEYKIWESIKNDYEKKLFGGDL